MIESITVPRIEELRDAKDRPNELAAVSSGGAWFYDASTELFNDYDGDGYYHYLRVRFDVDSYFDEHWVYARLFISDDGQLWDEYHVTGDFVVNGTSPLDDFEVETELVSGFPPGQYDILIELYDADFGDFLAEFGPADSSAFSLLPLEDIYYDEPAVVVTVNEGYGGGGSASVLFAALLAACLLARTAPAGYPRRLQRSHRVRRDLRSQMRTPRSSGRTP